MNKKCAILKASVIIHGDKRVCIYPVLQMSATIPPNEQAMINSTYRNFEKAMHVVLTDNQIDAGWLDRVAASYQRVNEFTVLVNAVVKGTVKNRQRGTGTKRSRRQFTFLKNVNRRVE